MKIRKPSMFLFLALFIIGFGTEGFAQETDHSNPEDVVKELYQLVTIEKGSTGEWDKVRALFLKEAVVVLRTSREATSVFTLEGFVNDFVKFINDYKIKDTGFNETILNMKSWVYGDMAHVTVLYEAEIPDSPIPSNKGIDIFLLVRKEGQWKIAAITNEVPSPNNPIPQELIK